MAKVHIHPPDGAAPIELALTTGQALLVGREPSPEAVDEVPAETRLLPIASPLVSSNHALVWADQDGLHARDLRSKNGTFLRLSESLVSLHDAAEVQLLLAAPRPTSRAAGPREVDVADADAALFARRLRDATAEWLTQAGLSPELRVVHGDEPPPDDGRFSIRLVDGLALEIADPDAGRTQVRWDGLKSELFSYAYEQIGRWRACRAPSTLGPLAFASPNSARALREVLDAARAGLPLVLRGESGTGKTALAAIYAGRDSLRGGGGPLAGSEGGPPFITVHCAHLEPELAHSMLFGALKGSYTSCERTIVGAVKLADGGVLFLDDVDRLPLPVQAKLLRFLDDGQYEPLGHGRREPLSASVRVVAGTNADLRAAVRDRSFREDLYWRLHMGAVVRVPPLRERPEDVEQLLGGAPAGPTPGARGQSVRDRLDADALALLLHRHPWRGNFRECLRFCARVRMEPAPPLLDRRRCEAILAEAALDSEAPDEPSEAGHEPGGGPFARALAEALRCWTEAEGGAPERFDELGRFCEGYLKSIFVACSLGLEEAAERPETFDRARRQRLGCDLTTLKRKMDDYLALKQTR